MIGRKPWRIDILSQIDGVTFEQCWPKRVEAEFEPALLPVIGRAQLIANKRASGRPKDLVDVAMLEDAKPPRRPRKRAAKTPVARRKKV